MSDESNSLKDAFAAVAGKWTAYAAVGSFILYLFGYLSLRFQLSTYGVATDLDVLDEKYLFAGSRFLVFLVSSAANALLIIFVLCLVVYIPYKLIPAAQRARIRQWNATWTNHQPSLSVIGIAISLVFIQLVLRKCFVFGDLLLAQSLPQREWISSVLLTREAMRSLYFTALLGGILVTGLFLMLALNSMALKSRLLDFLLGVQVFLFAMEFLFLPVNYGVLIATQELPRVMEVSDQKLALNEQAWLVWENKDVLTYLVRELGDKRALVTVPRKENQIRIVAYDNIFHVLFSDSNTPPNVSGGTQ